MGINRKKRGLKGFDPKKLDTYSKRKAFLEKDFQLALDSMKNRSINFDFTGDDLAMARNAHQVYRRSLEGDIKRHRQKILLDMYDKVQKKFSSIPGLNDNVWINFAHNETIFRNHYNLLDYNSSFRLGAAIWILEELYHAGKLEEAYPYLVYVGAKNSVPDSDNYIDTIFHPYIGRNLIQAMLVLLTNRYKFNSVDFKEYDVNNSIITDSVINNDTLCENYRKVLDLLPASSIERACNSFKSAVWDCLERNLKGMGYYIEKLNNYMDECVSRNKAGDPMFSSDLGIPKPEGFAILNQKRDDVFSLSSDSSYLNPNSAVKDIFTSVDCKIAIPVPDAPRFMGLLKHFDYLNKELSRFVWYFDYFLLLNRKGMEKEKLDSFIIDNVLSGFHIENPFEMCFALIYLLDSGDETPWLFRPGGTVMSYTYAMLPWAFSMQDEAENNADDLEKAEACVAFLSEDGKKEGCVDFYHSGRHGRNFAQILFKLCNVVVPFGSSDFYDESFEYIGKEDAGLARALADMAHIMDMGKFKAFLDPERSYMDISDESDEDSSEDKSAEDTKDSGKVLDNEQVSVESLQQEISRYKDEIKKLKRSFVLEKQRFSEKLSEQQEKNKVFQKERQELIDLRELVFNQENDVHAEGQQVVEVQEVSYPYETKKRTVVFGGHDSFLKVIKPMFPTVRFVDTKNISFSPEIIRKADIVWIQNNCISHPQFWNVIRIANQYDVQVRYFTNAGVERCAQQLVEADGLVG